MTQAAKHLRLAIAFRYLLRISLATLLLGGIYIGSAAAETLALMAELAGD